MYKTIQKPLLIALLVNVLLAFLYFFTNLEYRGADDYFMAAILDGAFGNEHNPHLYFINILYGYALIPFYSLFPKISWYYIGEYLSIFISFTAITYFLVKKIGNYLGIVLSVAFIVLSGFDFYSKMQFTQCAAILSASGMLTSVIGFQEKRKRLFFVGSILIVWGSMMRLDAFLMGLPFFLIAVALEYKFFLKNKIFALLVIGAIAACIALTQIIDSYSYRNANYSLYKEFQGPRAVVGDSRNYNITAVLEDLKNSGKSPEDFQMAKTWKFYDTQVFASDIMRGYAVLIEKYRNKITLKDIYTKLTSALTSSLEHPVCCFFFLFCILLLATNPKKGIYPWLSFMVLLMLMAYLVSIERLVFRVEAGLWIYATILSIPFLKEPKKLPIKYFVPIIVMEFAVSVIFILGIFNEEMQLNKDVFVKETNKYALVDEFINDNPNCIFMFSLPQYMNWAKYQKPIYMAQPQGSFKRTIGSGYWNQYLPEITNTLNEFGITNPFRDMVKENFVVVGDPFFKDYLERHYYSNIKIDTLKSIEKVHFYKYKVEE